MQQTEDDYKKIITKYKYIINHPYWIYKKDAIEIRQKLSYTSHNDIPLESVKDFIQSTIKLDVGGMTNTIATEVINALLLYGVHTYLRHIENQNSEYIVQLYLMCVVGCLESDGTLMDLIDETASDLLGMSSLKFSRIAEEKIHATTLEIFRGFFNEDEPTKYYSRRGDFIFANVRNRMVAFLTNISIIYNLSENKEFQNLIKRYDFKSFYDLKEIQTSYHSADWLKIEKLTDISGRKRGYVDCIRKKYDKIFSDIGQDTY